MDKYKSYQARVPYALCFDVGEHATSIYGRGKHKKGNTMGATTFSNTAFGKNAEEAFITLIQDARHENGHGGYTGTIAEKHDYVIIVPEVFDSRAAAETYADKLMEEDDPRISDKWGPAGCLKYKSGDKTNYLFFGWASE